LERVIRLREHAQRGARPEPPCDVLHKDRIGKSVASTLQKQHRNADIRQVLRAIFRRLAGRVQRKPEEDQAADARQRRRGLRLRCHASAERLAPGEQRQASNMPARRIDRRAHRRLSDARRIGSPGAALHVEELIAQGRNIVLGQSRGNCGHE
jgi:hypothetical protein